MRCPAFRVLLGLRLTHLPVRIAIERGQSCARRILHQLATDRWIHIAWTSEIQADVSVALTNFRDEKSGEKYRQLALVVAHGYGKRLHEVSLNKFLSSLPRQLHLKVAC